MEENYEGFVLHKILVSQKRKDMAKKEKDLLSSRNIGELCMKDSNRRNRLIFIFQGMPGKWQKQILHVLQVVAYGLVLFLKSKQSKKKKLCVFKEL